MPVKPLHVGLNLVYLVPGEIGGMETYARGLIPALIAAAPEVRLTAFINREAAEAGGGPWGELLPAEVVPVRARNRAEWVRGEQQLLPGIARRAGVDLLHSLASTSPAWGRFRRVVTIHDLIYRFFPEAHFGVRTLGMRLVVPLAARRCHRIIAISSSTRDDLDRTMGIDRSRIDVVPQGFGSRREGVAVADERALRAELGLGNRKVLLTVSAKRPVKNLMRLLEALAQIPGERRPVLVMPGYATPHEGELHERIAALALKADVRMMHWISDAELEGLYALAAAFVFPSLYEGFGAPVLEAMSRGVPVACSSRGSLAEVSGDAALHFDPERVEDIAAAIERLLGDGELRDRLRDLGRVQAAQFTWERTALGTLESYRRAVAPSS